jgi:hypothetical protein
MKGYGWVNFGASSEPARNPVFWLPIMQRAQAEVEKRCRKLLWPLDFGADSPPDQASNPLTPGSFTFG